MKLNKKQIEAVQFYKLGKITEAINCFESSINQNVNNELIFESLGICYMEIGKYEKSIDNFSKVLNLNNNSEKSIYSIFNLLNIIKPKNFRNNNLVSANEKIMSLNDKFDGNIPENSILKDIFKKAENYTKDFDKIDYKETQIFRTKNKKLGCDRHFKIFNKFQIIPKYCFSCYKIQIITKNVFELIKLYFLFNESFIEKSILRKCMIELRPNVRENYKGLIYFSSLEDSVDSLVFLKKKIIESKIQVKNIDIKHGCSEFYKKHPDFKEINFKGKQVMNYNKNWDKFEKIVDSENTNTIQKDNLFLETTLNIMTISDFFIIKNWLTYAKILGDKSYEKICKIEINNNFLINILKEQYDFRKKEF